MGPPPKTLPETLTPIMWLNWICCRGIFEIGGRRRHMLSLIYLGTISFGYFIIITWYLPEVIGNWDAYRRLSFLCDMGMNLGMFLIFVVTSCVNEKRFKKLIVRCEEINKTLKTFGTGEDYGEMSRAIKRTLIIWLVLALTQYGSCILWALNDLDISRAIIVSISVETPIVMNSVDQLNYVEIIWCIDRKLSQINSLMSELIEAENFNRLDMKQHKQFHKIGKITIAMNYSARKNFTWHLLGTLKQAHLEIIRISSTVNEIFCLHIILDLIEQFVVTVTLLYNICFEIISPSSDENSAVIVLVIISFWVFLSVAKLVFLNNHREAAVNKTKIMGYNIRELDCLFTDKDIKEEIQQFSLQLTLHPLYFTIWNLFFLNNGFTSTFYGTVATYLVILIQMTITQET